MNFGYFEMLYVVGGFLFLFLIRYLYARYRKLTINVLTESVYFLVTGLVLGFLLVKLSPITEITIRYYGVLFGLAAVMGLVYLKYLFSKAGYDSKMADDFMIYFLVGIVVGARLVHVVFYNPDYYFSNPSEIIKVWHGGIASHGVVVGGFTAIALYVWKKDITFHQLLDLLGMPMALATVFIRLGNFINGEIVGRVTDLPWSVAYKQGPEPVYLIPKKVFKYYKDQLTDGSTLKSYLMSYYNLTAEKFKGLMSAVKEEELRSMISGLPRHPSQIYEMINGLIVFGILYYMSKKYKDRLSPGILGYTFFIAYFTLRFLVEFVKEFQSLVPSGLTMGQYLSLAMLLFAVGMVVYIQKKKKIPSDITN